jgi:hypothetical protein
VVYEQWTLLSSGVLKVTEGANFDAQVCAVGAGANGTTENGTSLPAGGGAFLTNAEVTITADTAVTIGASGTTGGTSAFGEIVAHGGLAPTASGVSGTGAGTLGATARKGDGISKYPFGDKVTFAGRAHCAGGAAAGQVLSLSGYNPRHTVGGDGGTDGGYGGIRKSQAYVAPPATTRGGVGGVLGGGYGGQASRGSSLKGGDATFYGGGGGNGGYWNIDVSDRFTGVGGYGYQGVVYLRWRVA